MSHLFLADNKSVFDHLRREGIRPACAYIDPPYNNGDRTFVYDDSSDLDEWIATQTQLAKQLLEVLPSHGSAWYSIDDSMMHYLKVALDKVYGRRNFVTTICWEHRKTRENRAIFSSNHEYILVYAKNIRNFQKYRNCIPAGKELLERYKNPDQDLRGPWQSISLTAQSAHATRSQFYEITAPNGTKHSPPRGRCWIYNFEKMQNMISEGKVYFGKDGKGVPRLKRFLSERELELTPSTLWLSDTVGTTASAKKHILRHTKSSSRVFDTPKPVELLKRIISIATKPGDSILDLYLGSGTSIEAAELLGRDYIGVEILEEVASICSERLKSCLQKPNKFDFSSIDTKIAS